MQGEAGIGKSRLLEALREQVQEEDYIWGGPSLFAVSHQQYVVPNH